MRRNLRKWTWAGATFTAGLLLGPAPAHASTFTTLHKGLADGGTVFIFVP
jgi:hypothetical protein